MSKASRIASPRGRLFVNVALIGFGLILSFGAVELILRTGMLGDTYYQGPVPEGNTLKPKHKIMILGDSFLTSWGSTGLSDFLIKDLAAEDAEVLNTAEAGNGPVDYLTAMKAYAPSFKPDLVLLFYYAGNDLTAVQYANPWRDWLKKYIKPCLMKSRLFYFLKEKRKQLFERRINYDSIQQAGVSKDAILSAQKREINPWLLDLTRERKNFIHDNILMETPDNMRAWSEIQGLLKEIHRASAKMNAQFMIVMIPHTVQVSRSHFDFYQKLQFNMDDRALVSDKPQALLNAFCERNQIPCLDLLPHLRAESQKELYRDKDDHFNRAGAELSSQRVLDFLTKNTSLTQSS